LLTTDSASFFAALGYTSCRRDDVPASIRATAQFAALCPQTASVMSKKL
jgi:amino-acid N-acetyltransferase